MIDGLCTRILCRPAPSLAIPVAFGLETIGASQSLRRIYAK